MRFHLPLFFLFLWIGSLAAELDLEHEVSSFVLETKQIHIPGYPAAFNPSVTRWNGLLLMSFRIFPNPNDIWIAKIGIIQLDDSFNPIGEPQILDSLEVENRTIPHSLEDARLFTHGDRLYIAYNDHQEPDTRWLRRVCFAELIFDGIKFFSKNREIFLKFEKVNPHRQEKNWMPFVYQDRILFSYSLNPHRILQPLGPNRCETVAMTKSPFQWDWGEMRGSTPAYRLGNQYLAFFHSLKEISTVHSQNNKMLHYLMGAYTFQDTPPFPITQISQKPIVAKGFYKPFEKYHWGPRRVVYPGGTIFDDDFIWVSYGRGDLECWIMKLDRKKLLESLMPVDQN